MSATTTMPISSVTTVPVSTTVSTTSSTTMPVTTTVPVTTAPTTATAPPTSTTPSQVSYVDVAGLMSVLKSYLVQSPLIKNTNGDQIDTSVELNNINTNLGEISTALSSNTSGNILAQQNGVDSIVTNEMHRLQEKKQTIDSAITTQHRMMQMNDSYTKRQRQYTKMMVAVAVGITLLIVMSYVSFAFPEWSALATIANIIIIVLVFIFCFWTYYYVLARNSIYYDELNIHQIPFPISSNGASGTLASATTASTGGLLATCTGQQCCSPNSGTIWDSSHNICVKESFTSQGRPILPFEPSEDGDYTRYWDHKTLE